MDANISGPGWSADPHSAPPALSTRPRHSGAGIASTVAGALSLAHFAGLFVAAAVLSLKGMPTDSVSDMAAAAVLMSAWGLAFLSVGLGIGALSHPSRRKLFSVIGTATGAIAVVAWAILIVFGAAVAGYL